MGVSRKTQKARREVWCSDEGLVVRAIGVLTVWDASSRFTLDRWLRSGGQQALRVAKVRLSRVKVVV